MKGLYQRPGSPFWYFDVPGEKRGQRVRRSTKTANYKEAQKVRADALRHSENVRDGIEKPTPRRVTVDAALDAVIADMKLKGRRSIRTTESHMKPLRAALGDRVLSEITAAEVRDYQLQRRNAKKSPRTIDAEIELLARSYRLPMIDQKPPHIEYLVSGNANARQGFFEAKEIAALIAAMRKSAEPDLADFFEFLLLTGRRDGEVALYEWAHLSGESLIINPEIVKDGEPETLFLDGPALEIIERRRKDSGRRLKSPLIFHRDGQRIGRPGHGGLMKWAYEFWRDSLKAARITAKRIPHDARRSLARIATENGVPESQTMKQTGHKTRSMFDRYNIQNGDAQKNAQRAVANAIAGAK